MGKAKTTPTPTVEEIAVAHVLAGLPVDANKYAEPLATVLRETAGDKNNATRHGTFKASAKKHGLKNIADLLKGAAQVDVNTAQATGQSRFKIYTGDDALNPLPPITYLVGDLFAESTVNLIVGEPGSKKTYAMLDMLVCVAAGDKWLNYATHKCTVLIVDEESGERRLKRRLGGTMRGHSVAKNQTKIFCTSLSGLHLLEEKEQDSLEQLAKDTGAKLILIDALVDTLIGGDENSSADMQTVFQALRRIAENTCAAVVVIHHNGKNGGYRGSSAIHGAIDTMISVESKPKDTNIEFKTVKTRDSQPFSFAAIANFFPDETFNLSPSIPTAPIDRLSDSEQYVVDYLKKKDAALDDIEDHASGCSGVAARRAVYRLARNGKIVRKNAGARGVQAIYGLAKKIP